MNVELRGICKRFGSVAANAGVDLSIRPGEVLALLGENGAGKSTLMKILYGIEQPDAGAIHVEGKPVEIRSPARALELGVGMVFQHFSLIPALSVLENLLLGTRGMPWLLPLRGPNRARALDALKRLAPELDPERRVAELSVGEQQIVELAKVLARGARLVILDEPTSVIARAEAEALFARVRELADSGHAVVLITHKLDDVRACADRVVVLRAGRVVAETSAVTDSRQLVAHVMGEAPAPPEARQRHLGPPILEVQSVSARLGAAELTDIGFEARSGEVLGIGGVTGNGQELLGRVLAGVASVSAGRVSVGGRDVRAALEAGAIAYVPEQPLENGAARSLSVLVNLHALDVARLPLMPKLDQARRRAEALLDRFDVRPRDLERPAGSLSGGNLQKLVVARELSRDVELVVACFPTMGLDFGAARRIEDELGAAAARGAAVVWISEDLDALLGRADRVAVLQRGRLRGPVNVRECSLDELGAWMTGAAA